MNQELKNALIKFGRYMEDGSGPVDNDTYEQLYNQVREVIKKYDRPEIIDVLPNLDLTWMIYGILFYGASRSIIANMERGDILDVKDLNASLQDAIDNQATLLLGAVALRMAVPLLLSEMGEAAEEQTIPPSDQPETPSQ